MVVLPIIFLPALAQQKPNANTLSKWLERNYAKQLQSLKSYYNDPETAELCESWRSCSQWAFYQYAQDQTFKIVRAKLTKKRHVYRHQSRMEERLYVQATLQDKTINLMFTSPTNNHQRGRPYQFTNKFPEK